MSVFRFPAALLLVLAVASSDAAAPTNAAALTGAESSCRDTIAKSVTRYAASAGKAVVRCHQRRSSGARGLDVNCNDVAQADGDGRLDSVRARVMADVLTRCSDISTLLDDYQSCPAPASSVDDGGATAGIDDAAELTLCLLALGDAHAASLGDSAQGLPPERILDPLRKCQGALGKGTGRIVRSIMRERRRCQARDDDSGGDGGYACDSSDPRGRIQRALASFAKKTAPQCDFAPEVLGQLDACSSDSTGLLECASTSAAQHGAALIREAYSLSAVSTTTTTLPTVTTTTLAGTGCGDTFPQCDGSCPVGSDCVVSGSSCACVEDGTGPCAPATIRRSIYSKFSTEVDSVTSLNAGWSGLGFDIDVPDGSSDTVDVTCDENCENCSVSLKTEVNDPRSNCRCTSDSTISCTEVNGSDPTNCGGLDPTCRCYFGAPLAISAGGNPACVAIRIRSDYDGTMNLRTGEWSDGMHLAAVVYLGLDAQRPCPTCEGDPVPNDGVRGGTCNGGVGSGACDANGVHPVYGSPSNDCLPLAAANISGTGLLIDLALSTSEVSLPAALPCETPNGELCPCRTCTGNSLLACSSDAQCAANGAGTCTATGGAGVRLNQCDGFQCSANSTCTTGPVDMYCDGKLYPDGSGYIPCTNDSDCSSGSAGSCTIPALRRCFPDPITYTGIPDRYEPTKVSAFCVAPTSNPAINLATGLPGPGALLLTVDHDIRCQSDPSLVYEFPSGANCGDINTTTTTLLPLPGCDEALSPVCGGVCPLGQVCSDSGGTCACTGIPLPSCGDATAPLCGGLCADPSQVCLDNEGSCECMVLTLPQCTGAAAPVCGGLCPNGEICTSVGNDCECGAIGVPGCGTAISPTCAGVCDVGQVCIADGGSCGCLQLPVPTCAESTLPLCLGTCTLGSLCGDIGGACGCTPLPIP